MKHLPLAIAALALALTFYNTYRIEKLYTFFESGAFEQATVYIIGQALSELQP